MEFTLVQTPEISQESMQQLLDFKATERKDDPQRRQGIHGPYEELTLYRTGRLPADYYEPDSEEPWGLRVAESRSNLLWQVLSGILDNRPEFAASYMALALDKALSDNDYSKELNSLNSRWRHYWEHAGSIRDHDHGVMRQSYHRVDCPACSTLTALSIVDEQMHALFKKMLPLTPTERQEYLASKGLMPLLDKMIPDKK